MNSWYSSIYKSLILASVISFLISFFSSGNIAFGAMLSGYCVLILGIMMLLLMLFIEILKVTQGQGAFKIFYELIISTGPFILMLGIIGFITYLIITYKTIIIDHNVSDNYYTFSNITLTLILIQLYIIYTSISSSTSEGPRKISTVTGSLLYLLGILSMCSSLIVFTILKYYTTDGFSIINKLTL